MKRATRYCTQLINCIALFFAVASFVACNQNEQAKPLGEVRLEYPKAKYQKFDTECPYTFEYSTLAKPMLSRKGACQYTIHYPKMKANIFLTYFRLRSREDLIEKIKESEKFVQEQTIKASYISPREFSYPAHRVYGTLFELGGESAINYKFHVTDSVKNFISGSVYFSAKPNPDSLAPAVQYIEKDVMKLIETTQWKN
ncbi:gliding motility lipoprotein GldD [Vaginella massiliensis]|uniref:gliding motility lipoprotein GldD n=1 Tax=Vaginella massiliensis TaxID=1816680 RepID=UPI003750034E